MLNVKNYFTADSLKDKNSFETTENTKIAWILYSFAGNQKDYHEVGQLGLHA